MSRAHEQMRNRNGHAANAREAFMERVRAARKRLSKAAPQGGAIRLR